MSCWRSLYVSLNRPCQSRLMPTVPPFCSWMHPPPPSLSLSIWPPYGLMVKPDMMNHIPNDGDDDDPLFFRFLTNPTRFRLNFMIFTPLLDFGVRREGRVDDSILVYCSEGASKISFSLPFVYGVFLIIPPLSCEFWRQRKKTKVEMVYI